MLHNPDQMVLNDTWSDLRQYREMPEIDFDRLFAYREGRLRAQMQAQGVGLLMLVNPISLRYAAEYRTYGLFQAHIPTTYLLMPAEGPASLFSAYSQTSSVRDFRPGRPIHHFDGGDVLADFAALLAQDIRDFLSEHGDTTGRVALEYVNPSLTQALERLNIEVVDGVPLCESARVIKSEDEVACIRWACAVAQLGIAKLEEALRPGVTEALWALLNYTNLANDGDWHDGRMLASGERINPWLQEASQRVVQDGDLGRLRHRHGRSHGLLRGYLTHPALWPSKPTRAQKALYREAVAEVEHNMALIRPGVTLNQFRERARAMDERFHAQAYTCMLHAVGMCDEYPQIKHPWQEQPYDCEFEAGMVLCVESYCGEVGGRDGVKLEQQVLVTEDGIELLSDYPWDARLMD